ncbi:hypothetical protein IJG76_00410 [Candidatus Saccharibacteria bacterium]|nr:hypothetical protein [Candidatus Saccharibacteria bacterium]
MYKEHKKVFFLYSLIVLLAVSSPCFAERAEEELYGGISQYCGTIKQTLTAISHDDSRMRAELGAYYEKIANNYIIPLNARFVKSNQPNVGLLELQKQFAEEREEFNESYIEYARGMEVLIAVDCKKEPEKFYGQLTKLREARAVVNQESREMEEIIEKFYYAVEELYEK